MLTAAWWIAFIVHNESCKLTRSVSRTANVQRAMIAIANA